MAFTVHCHGGPYDQRTFTLAEFDQHVVVSEEMAIEADLLNPPPVQGPIDRKGRYEARPGTLTGNRRFGSADYDWQGWA